MKSRFTAPAIALVVACFLSACVQKVKKADDYVEDEPAASKPFDQGMIALEKEEYAAAARIFDSLLIARPATELDLVTIYNSGAAHEGLQNCGRAAERYREVVRASAGKFRRLEAESLFRLSIMYECLGQNTKAVTSLLDARKREQYLSFSVREAELPARLAAAYARLGNNKKALEYFTIANNGLKHIVAQENGRRQAEILGNTLYLMGQLNPAQRKAEGDPLAFLKGLSMQQPYLLQAVELNQTNWSKRAAADLDLAYDNIWRFKIEDRKLLNEYYLRALQVIREMRRIRGPKPEPLADAIFAKLDATESRLQSAMADVAETTPLSSEAQKREGLKREGRLVDPKPAPAKKKR